MLLVITVVLWAIVFQLDRVNDELLWFRKNEEKKLKSKFIGGRSVKAMEKHAMGKRTLHIQQVEAMEKHAMGKRTLHTQSHVLRRSYHTNLLRRVIFRR